MLELVLSFYATFCLLLEMWKLFSRRYFSFFYQRYLSFLFEKFIFNLNQFPGNRSELSQYSLSFSCCSQHSVVPTVCKVMTSQHDRPGQAVSKYFSFTSLKYFLFSLLQLSQNVKYSRKNTEGWDWMIITLCEDNTSLSSSSYTQYSPSNLVSWRSQEIS